MNHSEILQKWMGKNYIEPWMKTAECVAWAKKYCEERGYPIKSFGGSAWNGWKTWIPFDDSWVRINYKPWTYPRQGDIVFWSEWRCTNGHVAVAWKFCNEKVLRCTDENGKGKWDPVTPRFYNYDHVVGWFSKLSK